MIPIAKPLIGEEEKTLVANILDSGMLAQGKHVKLFEEEFASYLGVKHAIATANGTLAINALLRSMGIGPGDEVITTSVSFFASASQIVALGAKVVFADVHKDTYNIDPDQVRQLVTDKTKAIFPVHLYGQPSDMKELMEIGEEQGIPVIEDACQSHGAEYGGVKTGGIGLAGTFSFYPTKNMTSIEGGMITTNDDQLAEKCRLMRDHGAAEHYKHTMLGFNFRMTEVNAAVGIVQLRKLEGYNKTRQRNAQLLSEGLLGVDGITVPRKKEGRSHVFHLYCPLAERRDELLQHLRANGVGAVPGYPSPIYQQEAFVDLGYGDVSCPVAEEIVPKMILIPVHPAVSEADVGTIVAAVRSFNG